MSAVSINVVSGCDNGYDNSIIAVSMRDACKMTGLSRATLNRMTATGNLRKLRCGSKVLFLVEELHDFINNLPLA